MSLGLTEIILILIVILVLFGGKRIPELAKGLGRAQYEYKKAKEMLENEVENLTTAGKRAIVAEKQDAPKRRGRPAGSKNKKSGKNSKSSGKTAQKKK